MARLHQRLRGRVDLTAGPRLPDPAEFELLVAGAPTPAHLAASPQLRAVIVPFAGIPRATRELLSEHPRLALHNLHHNAAATAETALGLLLAASKRLVPADRDLRRGDWSARYREREGLLLAGRTVVVVGLGAIGARVARACSALGLRVLGVRRDPSRPCEHAAEVHGVAALDEVLPRAELLVLCCPATPQSEGLLDARRLALLPRGAVLVNVGRGALIAEQPLYEALREGSLGAAGLDVWWRYPQERAERSQTPPSACPFGELDNVVLSPHRGGHGAGIEPARVDALAALLLCAAEGRELPNRVDVGAGY